MLIIKPKFLFVHKLLENKFIMSADLAEIILGKPKYSIGSGLMQSIKK